jgi:hypothetical protein
MAASAGTLLSDLDGKPPVFSNDDDLVKKIMADINHPSPSNPVVMHPMPQAAMNHAQMMPQQPNPNTTFHMSSDPSTATAHMIGKDYPTNADFANMMRGPTYPQGAYGQMPSHMQHQMMGPAPTLIDTLKGNMYTDLFIQMKQPIIVAFIVFIVSLPAINILIGHYVPTLLRMGGDLTTAGLLLKSAIAGFLFWFIQKVLVPLMMV